MSALMMGSLTGLLRRRFLWLTDASVTATEVRSTRKASQALQAGSLAPLASSRNPLASSDTLGGLAIRAGSGRLGEDISVEAGGGLRVLYTIGCALGQSGT